MTSTPQQTGFYTDSNERVDLGSKIGGGGEGSVYLLAKTSKVRNPELRAVKLLDGEPNEPKLRLLLVLARQPGADTIGILYPLQLLYRQRKRRGGCVGYMMNYRAAMTLRSTVCQPQVVGHRWGWSRLDLCRLCLNILRRFINLHNSGLLMGDVNDRNILTKGQTGKIYFVDVDSYQVDDHPCPMHTPEFDSPALMDCKDFSRIMRRPEDEYYSISVLLFKIMMAGREPFASSGFGSVERNRRERRFVYPVGYASPDSIHGPWLRIWYNLPMDMRIAFHETFRGDRRLSPSEWCDIISNYEQHIRRGAYPRAILIPRTEHPKRFFLGQDLGAMPQVATQPALRRFATPLHPEEELPAAAEDAFVEFGAASVRIYEPQPGAAFSIHHIRSGHFDFIDADGRMDIDRLLAAIGDPTDSAQQLPYWLRWLRGVRPKIGRVVAFGGAPLRYLANRQDLVETLRRELGISLGITTPEEDVRAMMHAAGATSEARGTKVIVNVEGMAATIAVVRDGQLSSMAEFPELGSRLLRNGLFSAIQPDSRTDAVLRDHDILLRHRIDSLNLDVSGDDVELCGMGVLGRTTYVAGVKMDRGGDEGDLCSFRLATLEEAMSNLTKALLDDRPKAATLMDKVMAVDYKISDLPRQLELRLALPLYVGLMHRLGLQRVRYVTQPIGLACIDLIRRGELLSAQHKSI